MQAWTRAEFLGRSAAVLAAGTVGLEWLAEGAAAADVRPGQTHHYRSRPDLRPPFVKVLHRSGHAPGQLFLAPSSGPGQRGVLILDERGNVVWFKPTTPNTAMNFRPALYHGKPVLTWWEGHAVAGLGVGTHVILDDRYREVARFPAGGGRQSDLHEFVITPHGTALVTSYETKIMNTVPWGGETAGKVVGGIVQELALPSGKLLWEWKSLDHVTLEESYARPGDNFFDYFHINSIELAHDGNLIVSARNTWGIYKISRRTGKVLWRLGGKKSDFHMGKGTVFAWQHDARLFDGGRILTLFDDGSDPPVEPQSRALVLRLDTRHMTARLQKRYVHRPGRLRSRFMGNAQLLGNGNMLVGWGGAPYVSEFAPNGSTVFEARLPGGGQNYRAYRFPWVGRPSRPPRIKALPVRRLFVSWNGATEVAAWRLRSGKARGALVERGTVEKHGFETELRLPRGDRFAAAVALDAHGKPLGHTSTIRI